MWYNKIIKYYLNKNIMTYSTVEACIENKKVIFSDDFIAPKENMKILVTFIETYDDTDYWLYELDENEVTDEMKILSDKVLKKDKKLFTNI